MQWTDTLLLLPLVTAAVWLFAAFREKTARFNAPLQFWLIDLISLAFCMAAWMALVPTQSLVFHSADRFVLCLCALLATHDIPARQFGGGRVLPKVLALAALCLFFALTQGLGVLAWWALALPRLRRQPVSATGSRIVLAALSLYAMAFFLPLDLPAPSSGYFSGASCFLEAFREGLNVFQRAKTPLQAKNPELFLAAWLANPLFWIAGSHALRGHGFSAALLGALALALGLSLYAGSVDAYVFMPAYHVWLFSMALLAVWSAIAALRERRVIEKPQSPPAA
jgi:hypothetical protein